MIGGALLLLPAVGVASCGGKQELNFVGSDAAGAGSNGVSRSCGDRRLDAGEECDDGGRADADGCSAECEVETGWTCSGEPSTCVKCGNGEVEDGEQCDDGNEADGDGCSAACVLEGSCEAPVPIELTQQGGGLTGSVSSSTSESDLSQVGSADCSGSMSGDGADRIFQVELPTAADLEIKVGANFDSIVRVLTSPCDLDSGQVTCSDGAAVSGTEVVNLFNVPAGTYYVVVDGKTANQAGDFSVEVQARCPLEALKIDRVITSEPFRTHILNTSPDCSIDLSRVGLYFEPEAADAPTTLPKISLPPRGRRIMTSEDPPPAGTVYQGNIRYDLEDYAGGVYLCRDGCDGVNGDNVIDAFRWRGQSNDPPSTDPPAMVSFDGLGPRLADRARMSYFRVLHEGAAPNFLVDDFVGAYFVETFESADFMAWDAPADLFYDPVFEKVDGTIGAVSLNLTGGNQAAWNGPKHRLRDNSGMLMAIQPTYVSVRVRGSNKTVTHGEVFFGNPSSVGNPDQEVTGFGSLFRANGTLGFGSTTVDASLAYEAETWYLIEYKNFVFGAPEGSVEVYVNGETDPQSPSTTIQAASVSQLSIRNSSDATVWIDQIIVQ